MRKILLTMVAAAFTLAACTTEKIEPQDNSSISLSENEIIVGPEGKMHEITVTSSSDWKVSGYSEWARPVAETGKSGETLKFEIDASDTKFVRTADFKVFAGSAVANVKIVSNPSFVMDLLSDKNVQFSSAEGMLKVQLDTNIPEITSTFTDNGQDWIQFYRREDVFGKTILSYTVVKNETYIGRKSTLTLAGADHSIDIKVEQKQLDAILTESNKLVHNGIQAGELSFVVRSNVDFEYRNSLPNWLTVKSETKGQKAEDGLTPTTIVLAFGATDASRIADINFVANKDILLQISFKQANPNAVLTNIPDKGLRMALIKKKWVLGSDKSEECEILSSGLNGTELVLEESYRGDRIYKISGLGAFPKLAKLTIKRTSVTDIDLSGCKVLERVIAPDNSSLKNVILGDSAVKYMDTKGSMYDGYFSSEIVTVSGDNIEELDLSCRNCYFYDWSDKCATIDVSGCPKLKKLDVFRYYSYTANLKELHVSQAQLDAYNAGTLSITMVTDEGLAPKLIVK